MTARKKLMSLSLIALTVFSACTDEVETEVNALSRATTA